MGFYLKQSTRFACVKSVVHALIAVQSGDTGSDCPVGQRERTVLSVEALPWLGSKKVNV